MDLPFDKLPPKVAETLYKAGLTTCKSILESQECDLFNLGAITHNDLKQIYAVAASKMKPTDFITGEHLKVNGDKRWSHVSVGCPLLDSFLGGGVLTRGVTELAGESGCGKTQFCLQLCITVQAPHSAGGLAAGAVYICTEDRFPSVRLHQLLKSCPVAKKFPKISFGNNIFVEHIADAADLQKCMIERVPKLLKQHHIGLIVVDSVAGVFRADYSHTETVQRAKDMRTFASHLHSLANTHRIAVVCVNQVSDVKRGELTQKVPALGLAWANLVTCRLQMFRENNIRRLQIVFAPHLPRRSSQYQITEAGVVGISLQDTE